MTTERQRRYSDNSESSSYSSYSSGSSSSSSSSSSSYSSGSDSSEASSSSESSHNSDRPNSYGLICIRQNRGKLEMLLIRSKHTWQRAALVHGKYKQEVQNQSSIHKFVSKMSIVEKQSIVNSDVIKCDEPPSVFSHVGKHTPDEFCFICQYRECKHELFRRISFSEQKRHEQHALRRFMFDMPRLIRPMLQSIKNGEDGALPWSIPKGRPKRRKCDGLSVALKEFMEETQIKPNMYVVHKNIPPFAVHYIDAGKKWSFEFFFATAKDHLRFQYKSECKEQSCEVSLIQWHDFESLSVLTLDPITRVQLCNRMPLMFEHYRMHRLLDFKRLSLRPQNRQGLQGQHGS